MAVLIITSRPKPAGYVSYYVRVELGLQRRTAEVQNLNSRREDLREAVSDRDDHGFCLVGDNLFNFLDVGAQLDDALHGELCVQTDNNIVGEVIRWVEGDVREQLPEGAVDLDVALALRLEKRGDDGGRIDVRLSHED